MYASVTISKAYVNKAIIEIEDNNFDSKRLIKKMWNHVYKNSKTYPTVDHVDHYSFETSKSLDELITKRINRINKGDDIDWLRINQLKEVQNYLKQICVDESNIDDWIMFDFVYALELTFLSKRNDGYFFVGIDRDWKRMSVFGPIYTESSWD